MTTAIHGARGTIQLSDAPARAHGTSLQPALGEGVALDAYIAGRLVTAYALSEDLSPYRLHVDVEDGVATVSGALPDRSLRELAAAIARELPEIAELRCEIAVESPAPQRQELGGDGFSRAFRDATLAARVKSRLLWNGATHDAAIDVHAREQNVTLCGIVSAPEQRRLAEQIALEVQGVRRVENRLRLTAS